MLLRKRTIGIRGTPINPEVNFVFISSLRCRQFDPRRLRLLKYFVFNERTHKDRIYRMASSMKCQMEVVK